MQRSIRRLPPETSSRIAAGEVIERPLSALKEILENALDAGARSVEVRVQGSLDQAFTVADDGVGIDAGELELAFERHATSKITALDDLELLGSLGFRGEALPSIAAVSRLSLTSRPRAAASAGRLRLEGGAVTERGESARGPGTTIEVTDLFFNMPARRKFLHSPSGELRAAIRMIECYALAYPEVAFRLMVDDRERFDWPAVGERTGASAGPDASGAAIEAPVLEARRARAASLWGARHAGQLLDAEGERDGVRVAALLGLPEHARATREGQVFLINRRWVQNPMIGQALRQAYGNLLPAGRFPSAVLWITIPPARLDVNVHPTKREVRFADERGVFALVAGACAKTLAHLQPPLTVVPGGRYDGVPPPDEVRDRGAEQFYLGLGGALSRPPDSTPPPAGLAASAAAAAQAAPRAIESPETELWQLHRTYILAPVRGALIIVDQHAAHERILYEEARARFEGERGASQQLLFPSLIDLTHEQFERIREVEPWLRQLGWDLRLLGPPSVVIQGVPAGLKREDTGHFLIEVLDGVNESTGRSPEDDVLEQLARSHACHAATRAGDALTQAEMRTLVDRLFGTSRPHGDPHGRPTYVRVELEELHRRFGRS